MSIEFEITKESITRFRKKYGVWMLILTVIYFIHPFEGFFDCVKRTQSNRVLMSFDRNFSPGVLDDFCEKKSWKF